MDKIFKSNIRSIFGSDISDNFVFDFFQISKSNFCINTEWENELGYVYYESLKDGLSILYIQEKLNSLFFYTAEKDGFNTTNLSIFNLVSLQQGILKIKNQKLYENKEIINNGRNINYIIDGIKTNITLSDMLSDIDIVTISLEE